MANGARFTHPELSALDQRISEAAARAAARERIVFGWLVKQVLAAAEALAACAAALALADVLQSAAQLALTERFCCPALSDDTAFHIEAGRHPVVDAAGRGVYSQWRGTLRQPAVDAADRAEHGR
jgi:DNA mismatch repair protein MutS